MRTIKNKNGFTLVELLITIAIITVILGIASMTVINLINNSKEKSIEVAKNNILSAAKMYTEEYANEIYWQENIGETEKEKFSCVSINELINKNFLKKDTLEKLPINHKYIVIWKSKNNSILSEEFDNMDYGKCQYIENNNFEIPKCEENLYYNKNEQILIKNPDTYGITLINYTATNIGLHQVTAKLRNGYKWNDGTTQDKTFNCEILAPQYKIKYNANGGTGIMEDSYHTYNEEKNLNPNNFTRTGHTFKNWNSKEDGTDTSYDDQQTIQNLTIENGKTINLYAQWNANTYTITYDGNGGNSETWGTTWSDTVTYGESYYTESNWYTLTGHTFIGWNEKADGTGTDWTNWIDKAWTWTYTKNLTLYAQWNINTYDVKFDANGGTGAPSKQTKTYGTDLILSSTKPTRNGHTFQGWGTSSSDTTVDYAAGAKYTDNKAITLYAIWKVDTISINNTRYSCQKYNSETFYRLSTFYITTCSNGNCTFNKLNGLTSSNSNATLSIITPPESTVVQNTLETSIPSNCLGTTYYITATGLNCRNIPTTSGSNITKTISQCTAITIVPTTTKYESNNSWYYNANSDCYLTEGSGNNKYISATKPSYCNTPPPTEQTPEKPILGENYCGPYAPLIYPYITSNKYYCCDQKDGPSATGAICQETPYGD